MTAPGSVPVPGSEHLADRPVLPDQTGDDLDVGWGEPADDGRDDERFLRERPPHWG